MIDPLVDSILENKGFDIYRPKPSNSDAEVLELAEKHSAPIITRDHDFIQKHRRQQRHHGIIFDPGMHHRPVNEVVNAVLSVFDLLSEDDLKDSVVRLRRFY